jgi:hypothetical protein
MNTHFEQRLSRLENTLRFYQLGFFILIIAVISIVFTSFNNKDKKQFADKITAKAFEVVDENGKVLINLSTYNGNGAITTFDKRGNYLVDIVSNTSGFGNINLYDGKGKATVQLYNVQGGGGAIAIKNKSGVDAMKLHLMTSGSGFISVIRLLHLAKQ